MDIQVGEPTIEGRYVVWTPCKAISAREWCEPSIVTWHGGRWHARELVRGWIGPLPLCNQVTLNEAQFKAEYDL